MLSIAAKEWLAEGKAEGKAEALVRVLSRRFGIVLAELRERISQTKVAQLDEWLDRAIDAPSLEAVFAPQAH